MLCAMTLFVQFMVNVRRRLTLTTLGAKLVVAASHGYHVQHDVVNSQHLGQHKILDDD